MSIEQLAGRERGAGWRKLTLGDGRGNVRGVAGTPQIQRSSTMVPHKSEVENAKTKKPPTTPLRHTESFSKRQVNAWYSMPWVTQADPTTKEGCWEAPGPSEFEVIYRIGEGLTSCVYLARIKRANVRFFSLLARHVILLLVEHHVARPEADHSRGDV
jgi:hypothetical protein